MNAAPELVSHTDLASERIPNYRLILPDSRVLSYARFGNEGPALMYFHGGASCRYEAVTGAQVARERGFQIIAADRPGYGGSSPRYGGALREWAEDVSYLADRLGLERFAVAGVSAGAAHALITGVQLRDRVSSITMINTAGDRGHLAWRAVPLLKRTVIYGVTTRPLLRRFSMSLRAKPAEIISKLSKTMPESDRQSLQDGGGALLATIVEEGLRQGLDAFVDEAHMLYHRPWEVRWAEAAVPVTMVHGIEDALKPFVDMVSRLEAGVNVRWIPGGHLGGSTKAVWEDLAERLLLAAMARRLPL